MKPCVMAALALLCLSGCVGVKFASPQTRVEKTEAYNQLLGRDTTPVITRTQRSDSTRQWCGISLWLIVLPVPLKLPVCSTYTEAAFGNDRFGDERVLVYTTHSVDQDPYLNACGPFMFLAPIMHGYEGNALCGRIP
ncbi:hypothetical protein KUO17_24255 [Pseudomonas sp. MAFF 301350]|uniref:Lipoprotein n=2 Tax=Pseudomonas aegrilactucae TaxID=2854028 RepID=A0A9Q3AFZ0_9PSED|nr:hypothetical protein [Pseudomonas aegrilactucae]MBV6290100.1 hypothetical protein [Pseudomonas aegrilactucae]